MTSSAAWTRTEARWAIAQCGVAEMHGVLAYAEAFAIVAAGAGVPMGAPARLVQRMVDATVSGALRWSATAHTFPVHLRKAVRLEIAGHLGLHGRLRGRGPTIWDARLAAVQVGDLRGVEALGHWAGEVMPRLRSNDDATLEEAIKLADFVRARLAPLAGEVDDEDTVRLRAPLVTEIALGDPEGGKPN